MYCSIIFCKFMIIVNFMCIKYDSYLNQENFDENPGLYFKRVSMSVQCHFSLFEVRRRRCGPRLPSVMVLFRIGSSVKCSEYDILIPAVLSRHRNQERKQATLPCNPAIIQFIVPVLRSSSFSKQFGSSKGNPNICQ